MALPYVPSILSGVAARPPRSPMKAPEVIKQTFSQVPKGCSCVLVRGSGPQNAAYTITPPVANHMKALMPSNNRNYELLTAMRLAVPVARALAIQPLLLGPAEACF